MRQQHCRDFLFFFNLSQLVSFCNLTEKENEEKKCCKEQQKAAATATSSYKKNRGKINVFRYKLHLLCAPYGWLYIFMWIPFILLTFYFLHTTTMNIRSLLFTINPKLIKSIYHNYGKPQHFFLLSLFSAAAFIFEGPRKERKIIIAFSAFYDSICVWFTFGLFIILTFASYFLCKKKIIKDFHVRNVHE